MMPPLVLLDVPAGSVSGDVFFWKSGLKQPAFLPL
jgi:hypothetical protein